MSRRTTILFPKALIVPLVLRFNEPTAGRLARDARTGLFGTAPDGKAAAMASGRSLWTASSAVMLAFGGLNREPRTDVALDSDAGMVVGIDVELGPGAGPPPAAFDRERSPELVGSHGGRLIDCIE